MCTDTISKNLKGKPKSAKGLPKSDSKIMYRAESEVKITPYIITGLNTILLRRFQIS